MVFQTHLDMRTSLATATQSSWQISTVEKGTWVWAGLNTSVPHHSSSAPHSWMSWAQMPSTSTLRGMQNYRCGGTLSCLRRSALRGAVLVQSSQKWFLHPPVEAKVSCFMQKLIYTHTWVPRFNFLSLKRSFELAICRLHTNKEEISCESPWRQKLWHEGSLYSCFGVPSHFLEWTLHQFVSVELNVLLRPALVSWLTLICKRTKNPFHS